MLISILIEPSEMHREKLPSSRTERLVGRLQARENSSVKEIQKLAALPMPSSAF